MIEEVLKRGQAQVNGLDTTTLKLNLLLGQQKQSFNKHGIRYNESSEVILLKVTALGKNFVSSSNKKPILAYFVCGRNDHSNYSCSCKNQNAKNSKMKWAVRNKNTK